MKKLVGFLIIAVMCTSCVIENCPSYGNTNKTTRYGKKAQVRYVRNGKGVMNPKVNPVFR